MENKEVIFREEIKEKVDEVIDLCRKKKFPIFLAVAIKDQGDTTVYEKRAVTPTQLEMTLNRDDFVKYLNVANGFKTVAPKELDIIEYVDL